MDIHFRWICFFKFNFFDYVVQILFNEIVKFNIIQFRINKISYLIYICKETCYRTCCIKSVSLLINISIIKFIIYTIKFHNLFRYRVFNNKRRLIKIYTHIKLFVLKYIVRSERNDIEA